MKQIIWLIFFAALSVLSIATYSYIDKFGFGYFDSPGDWGTLGDFFGGVLNPSFTLLSIVLLAYTLSQNKKALEQSQVTLTLNNEELVISGNALKSTSEAQHSQTIGNTFFNLLNQHNNIVNNLHFNKNIHIYGIEDLESGGFTGRIVFKKIVEVINSSNSDVGGCVDKYQDINEKHNDVLGHYFRNLFQIIKYIDEYSDLEIESETNSGARQAQKKNFIRMLRAQLSSDELVLLLLNCTPHMVDNGQFKDLLVKYEMLKHIIFDCFTPSGKSNVSTGEPAIIELANGTILSLSYFNHFYDNSGNSAFGDNQKAKEIKDSIREID